MTDRPVLALVAAPGTSARAVPLLGVLGRSVEVVSWQRRGAAAPDAVLATSLDALDLLGDRPGLPVGAWVRHHDEVDRARSSGVELLLTATADLVARGALLVPRVGIEVDRWPAVAPLVRARRREREGLPERHVVRADEVEGDAALAAALGVASSAVVHGPATLVALALGTPIVTSGDTARRLGLRPGRDVEIAASPDAALDLARAVAADDGRAASLSRRARRSAEHHLDLGRPARTALERLGLVAAPTGPVARAHARLDDLATPAGSPTWPRVGAALAIFGADGGGSGS